MNLLLDEMLSVRLPDCLAADGIFATHVVHRGLQGAPDHEIWRYANENDFTVATVNAGDYLKLAADTEIHTGIIVIRESGLTLAEQFNRIGLAVEEIHRHGEDPLINQVLDVQGENTVRWLEIPPI